METACRQHCSQGLKDTRFLRRNLYNCTKKARERTYHSLVVPTLNYAAAAWDPYQARDINQLEQVQRRGARFVHNNHWDRSPGCVSHMLKDLGWRPLQEIRQDLRLTLLYKIQHHLVDVDPGPILSRSDTRTRGKSRLQQATSQSTVYNNSFYPRTISQWNHLPILVTDSTCLEGFKTALAQLRASPSRTA
jgi:hypothetical protein